MPSLTNKPVTPFAFQDMTIADCYARIDDFITRHRTTTLKIEDDNHGMGMISTVGIHPKEAVNMRLDHSTIRNYLMNQGFSFTNDSICSRR